LSISHLHIVGNEIKFIKPFVKYINNNFDGNKHFFLILNSSKIGSSAMSEFENVRIVRPYDSQNSVIRRLFLIFKIPISIIFLFVYCLKSQRIYFHGLFDKKVVIFLYLFRTVLNKSYWLMWGGGDLDIPLCKDEYTVWDKMKLKVKGGFYGYISFLPGDFGLVKKLYNANGKFIQALMYESNTFNLTEFNNSLDNIVRIQVGNSADCANDHIRILDELKKFKNENIELYCILSYGEKPWSNGWTQTVIDYGEKIFGSKFIPVIDFMNFEEYLALLGKIDIAIFAHKRQQAMGNTISLLGLGKKVYIRSDTTSWDLFDGIGIKLFDVNEITIERLDNKIQHNNVKLIKNHFSKEQRHQQLVELFNI
jgi:dTDP-N-acetylfucosamine:lipid II N-acetylfucosaminyltransferase